MAKSYLFSLGVSWGNRQQTIHEAAVVLWNIFDSLSKADRLFSSPVFSKENQKDVLFKISSDTKQDVIESMALTLLNFSKYDIRKFEKEQNPTVNYSRPFGFSFVVTFYEGNRKCISFIPRIGSNEANGFSTISISRDFDKDFDWFFSVLKALVESSGAFQGGLHLLGSQFFEATKQFKRPLGWITYFSNAFNPEIPNDLEGIEYEFTDKGKYMILTRQDFTTDKETYEAHKQKLLNLMEEIKRRVPEYSK
jgi:hypothetical protein